MVPELPDGEVAEPPDDPLCWAVEPPDDEGLVPVPCA
jgi:hypothetical protein